MNNDDNLDLLDLNDDADSMDTLPDAAPFAQPRPKKPWLLLAVGVVVIILATYIIIRTIGGDSSSTMQVDLDGPAIMVEGEAGAPVNVATVPNVPANVAQPVPQPIPAPQPAPVPQPAAQPQPAPVAAPQPATTPGVPVRVIEDRKDVTFNPEKPVAQKPAAKPAAKKAQPARRAAKPVQQAPKSAWYAQLGSYSTRALAESGQRQLQNAHRSLFAGRQFVILAAQLKNGTTAYRLRVGFGTSADANAFCRNAKSNGLECYVTK